MEGKMMIGDIKSIPLSSVVSRYTPLKKVGREWKGLCPFHAETTPSFFVNDEKGVFYCFGCGAGGDIVTFIEKIEGVDFQGALQILEDLTGLSLSSPKGGPSYSSPPPPPTVPLRGSPGEGYWVERGLSLEVAQLMRAAYVPADRDHPLAGRVVIPLPKGIWVGRKVEEVDSRSAPKYLFYPSGKKTSAILPIWGKGKVLILVEGVLDAAAILSSVGVERYRVGALLGGRLSPAQRGLILSSSPDKVLLGMDMDEVGVRARIDAINLLRGEVPIGVIRWPAKDPGEALLKNPQGVVQPLENPLSPDEFLLRVAQKKFGGDLQGFLRFLSPFLTPVSPSDAIPSLLRQRLREMGVEVPGGPEETPSPVRSWPEGVRQASVEADIAALLLSMDSKTRAEALAKAKDALLDWPPLLQVVELGAREELEAIQGASLLWQRMALLPPMSPREAMDMLRILVGRANIEYLTRELNRAKGDPKEVSAILGLLEDVRHRLRRGEW